MPDLSQSLQGRDIGHLRIVSQLWGIELAASETSLALEELAAAMRDPGRLAERLETLPGEALQALESLAGGEGRMPWAVFVRRHGEMREMGPGRRDRENPHLDPVSTTESLFYNGLLARAFFDTPDGPQEFAYIPDDLFKIINRGERKERREKDKNFSALSANSAVKEIGSAPLGRLAAPKERARVLPASDRLLDDAATLLAALRMDRQPPETPVPVNTAGDFLRAAGILAGNDPVAEKVKPFLEMPRGEALSMLAAAWQKSETFNELRQVPGLICEGEWTNAPLAARRFLLALLEAIPKDKWWSLPAFVLAVREKHPDFQRPAGDYDSWFVKRAADGIYLRGFEHWDEVDGALVRYLVTGPMAWLGMADLATPEESEIVTAFRIKFRVPGAKFHETGKLNVASQGKITVPQSLPRAARYQIARFCEWDESKPEEYRYRVTTASLKKAAGQGLKVGQLLSLLAKNAAAEIPPAFVKSLKRWELNGTEARVEVQTVLRVSRPEALEELRKSKAGRFLGEILGPTAVVVKPGAGAKVLAALAELPLLAEEVHEE